jgi:hypothetical protein
MINKTNAEDYLFLMIDSYNAYGNDDTIDNIQKINLVSKGWEFLEATSDVNGYYANAYRNIYTGEIVIANRGTDSDNVVDFLTDMRSNYQLGTLQLPEQFETAKNFYEHIKNEYNLTNDNIVNVGHSLGGYLAQLVTIINAGSNSLVSNAPGVKEILPALEISMDVENGIYANIDYANIIMHLDYGKDIISIINEQIGSVYKVGNYEISPSDTFNIIKNHDKELLYNSITNMTEEEFDSQINQMDLEEYNEKTLSLENGKNFIDAITNLVDFQQSLLENPLQSITTWLQEHNKNIDSFADEMKEIFGIEREDFLSEIDKMLVERVGEDYSLDRLYGEYYTDFILKDGE